METLFFIFAFFLVLAVTRVTGVILKKVGQSEVIGEMIGGLIVGPSVLGALYPEVHNLVFTLDFSRFIRFYSWIGILIYMFTVGLSFRSISVEEKLRKGFWISIGSTGIPLIAGFLLGFWTVDFEGLMKFAHWPHIFFIGAAMSITAFPVLSRILTDKNLLQSEAGQVALSAAAFGDIIAWVFLVILAGSFRNRIGGEALIFGTFFLGILLRKRINFKAEPIALTQKFVSKFMLPFFFAFSGMRTQLQLIESKESWMLCAIVIAIAVLAKLGAGYFFSRRMGLKKQDSWLVGVLMNTRGLMELVILNIGLDLMWIGPKIFAILVVMAIVTTIMTGPLIEFLQRGKKKLAAI